MLTRGPAVGDLLRVRAQSETEFFSQPKHTRVTFERDLAGAVTGLIFQHGDKHSHPTKTA